MCEYCEKGKYISERNEYSRADCYIGLDMCINKDVLEIFAVGEVGYPSRDTASVEKEIKIKYCPVCGRNLNKLLKGEIKQ